MKFKIWGGVSAVIAGALFYATPYFTLYQLKSAVDRKDADGISRHVDFPALRDNVKSQMLARIQAQTDKPEAQNNPLAGLGRTLAAGLVERLTDTLVSPSGVMLMLEKGKPGKPADVAAAGVGVRTGSDDKPHRDYAVNYLGWSQVLVHPQGEAGGFILQRDGLLGWKIAGLRLDGLQ